MLGLLLPAPGGVLAGVSVVHAASGSQNCLVRNDWVCAEYVTSRSSELLEALGQHLYLTLVSLVIGAVVSLPLAVVAHRYRRARALTLGVTTTIYTIPSIALFFLIIPFLGLTAASVIAGLSLYSLTILVRNLLVGLDGVDPEVVDAATGMGYGPTKMLLRVQLPLALPSAIGGLRVAAVSTVALTTIGAVIGFGGFGNLLVVGSQSNFHAEVLTAAVACVILAFAFDLLLLGLQRVLTPWRRGVA